MRKIPPLNSLRAFDAVARNNGLSQAAAELCVSPSAVSQQIANLEDWMGVRLLERTSNKTSLSKKGGKFARQLNHLFDELEENVSQIRTLGNAREIRLSILPSLASRWLIHRLPQFSALHSGYRVMIDASFDLVDFKQDEFTLAIRSGSGSYPGCHSIKLFDEYVSPVCSPIYWENNRVSIADIGKCNLLADHTFGIENSNLGWDTWIERENIQPSDDLKPFQTFTDSNLTIQAAINSEGFMLGRSVLVSREIERGSLIAPFSNKQVSDWPYFVVYPAINHPPRHALRLFFNWLEEQAIETPGAILARRNDVSEVV